MPVTDISEREQTHTHTHSNLSLEVLLNG